MGVPCKVVRPCIAVPHEKPQIGSLSHLSNACVWEGTCPSGWVVYHVFNISYRQFIAFQWGGQLYMGVPCIHVRPCMAVPHEKPLTGSLSRLSNACRWVQSMPHGLFTMCLAWLSSSSLCFERGNSDSWGFHAQVSAHAWLSPTRNYTMEVCCTFQMDLYAQIVCPKGCLPYG